jgi:hypothetical protein
MNFEEQFKLNLGYYLGLNDCVLRMDEALSIKNPVDFMNFTHSNLFSSINNNKSHDLNAVNKGISQAYLELYNSIEKIKTKNKLVEIFEHQNEKIEKLGLYFLNNYNNMLKIPKTPDKINKNNSKIQSIYDIRKQKPFIIGITISFLVFSNFLKKTTKKNDFKAIFEHTDKMSKKIPEIRDKLILFSRKTDFKSIFFIGYIQMMIKLHSHFFFYNSDLQDYILRFSKIEKELVHKTRKYRLNENEIFTINEIFTQN